MSGGEYLLEVRTLEMPPHLATRALKRLGTRLFEDLMGRGLGPAEIVTGRTPRRLMVGLRGLPEVEPEREERRLGPPLAEAYGKAGRPTAKLRRFAREAGLRPGELSELRTERGVFVGAIRALPGRTAREVLAELVPRVLGELPWGPPAAGRGWRSGWIAGPRGVLSLFDGEVLAFEVEGVAAGSRTAGHPVHSPAAFEVAGIDDYLERLRALGIVVPFQDRRRALWAALERRAAERGGELERDPRFLERLAARCEVPGAVGGAFEPGDPALPREVVAAALAEQDALPVRDPKGGLLPAFVTVMDRADDPEGTVRAGQERVVEGRLADARFRFARDRERTLAERARRLGEVDFHPRLGSLAAKTERVAALVALIAGELGWDDVGERAAEAVALAKADLTTGMVRDFPALRGVVGGLYAREEGYVEGVWRTLCELYLPREADDPIPRRRVGRLVAVADRLDTLVGLYAVGPAPRGSKDPFALRRLARGLLRIVLEAGMELDLDLVTARAVLLYGDSLPLGAEDLLADLQGFLRRRARRLLAERGYAHDEIEAAAAVGGDNLPDLAARIEALRTVREEPAFRSVVQAAKRIWNIVGGSPEYELAAGELAAGAERELHERLDEVREAVERAVAERRYEDGLRAMEGLVEPLDRFFADVLVMAEDEGLRANRIALLQACRRVFWRIGRLKEMS